MSVITLLSGCGGEFSPAGVSVPFEHLENGLCDALRIARELFLQVETSSKDFLIEKGYNPNFGARPLRRAIEQYVEDQLAEHILRGDFKQTADQFRILLCND